MQNNRGKLRLVLTITLGFVCCAWAQAQVKVVGELQPPKKQEAKPEEPVSLAVGKKLSQGVYEVISANKKIGNATIIQTLTPDGGKIVETNMKLSGPNGSVIEVRQVSAFGTIGNPLRKVLETKNDAISQRSTTIINFTPFGAEVVYVNNGIRTEKNFRAPEGAKRDNIGEFWFLRDKPRLGQSFAYTYFNTTTQAWESISTSYVARSRTSGANRVLHRLESQLADRKMILDVDDSGKIVRGDFGDMQFVEIIAKTAPKPAEKPKDGK